MNSWTKPAAAEFLGTFGLIFMGAGAVVANHASGGAIGVTGIAFAHGLAIALGILALGKLSGGHFNPAVTIAMYVTNRIALNRGLIYIAAQLLGAALAALFLAALFPANSVAATYLGNPSLGPQMDPVSGILAELVATFFLVLVIFGTAVDPKGPGALAGFAIGLTVTMDWLAIGPLTGAAMNPARAFGPALVTIAHLQLQHIYWIGPVVGAVLAAFIYEHFLMDKS